jgi:Intrinsic membrane protein PufX
MSDKQYFDEPDRAIHLRVWALGQMVWGAFLAGGFLLGIVLIVWAIYLVGLLLPEESRQTPSPYGALEAPLVIEGHDLA